jgi:hypothetical protein
VPGGRPINEKRRSPMIDKSISAFAPAHLESPLFDADEDETPQ